MKYHKQETIDAALRMLSEGMSKRLVAAKLGISRQSVQDFVRRSEEAGTTAIARPCPVRDTKAEKPPMTEAPAPLTAQERRDADFYRRQLAEVRRDLDETRHALKEVAGLAGEPITPPEWALSQDSGHAQPAIGLMHISDTHVGEVVRAEEVNGLNAYDPDIFRRRIRRYVGASIEILPRWASDCKLMGVVMAVNGDLTSGDIHDELRRTNALTSTEQVMVCAEEIIAGATKVADRFGQVWLVFTPGNHGRSTEKTHAKRTAALSYDTLIGQIVKQHFANDARITVHVAPGRDAVYPILGHSVFQSHGDALGSGGGQGFAGPGLPIIRGSKKVEYVGMVVDQRYGIILTAHYHSSMNIGRIFANGSMIGWNEYALSIRATPEPPQQWLMLVTEKWGVRERAEIKLEDVMRAEKPRFRVASR